LNSVAAFVAPLVATNLFGYFIGPRAPVHLPGVPFFLGATLVFAALGVAIVTLRRVKFQV
jgi:DHA1 family tetracycline resistance protein-like MFS transporter